MFSVVFHWSIYCLEAFFVTRLPLFWSFGRLLMGWELFCLYLGGQQKILSNEVTSCDLGPKRVILALVSRIDTSEGKGRSWKTS